ncbi:Consortin [Pitangus sulphuratus]|nr:Consortin [Pitangus sulphuratus]
MDDSEFPPNDLQIDSKDSLTANYRVESLASHLFPSADENENQLDSDGNEVLTSSSFAMGRQDKGDQDNINNNENMDSGDCTPSCQESETERSVNVHMDPQLEEKPITEKQPGGKRSPRSKRSSSKKSKDDKIGKDGKRRKPCVPYLIIQLISESSLKVEEGRKWCDWDGFGVEANEIYEYKFVKFYENSRISTAGTATIKEENTLITDTDSVQVEEAVEAKENFHPKEQNQMLQSLFSLLRDEVEQMDSKILPLCLHQIAETYFQEEEYEKAMKFIQLERLYHERLLANLSSIQEQWGTETCPGIGPKKEDKQLSTVSSGENKTERQIEAGSLWVAAGKDHMEEQHCSAESTLEPHSQSSGTVGRPSSGCLSSGDAGKDNSLQLRERQLSKDAEKTEGAWEPGVKLSLEPMVDASVLTDGDYMPTDLVPSDKDVQADRNLLRSKHAAGSSEIVSAQLGNNDLKEEQAQPDDDDEKSSRDRTASDVCSGCHKVSEHESTAHSQVCKEIQRAAGQEEKVNNEEQEDLFLRFLNGNIIDTEESILENQEDLDTVPDISPERASYNSLEALSLDDSFSSLDELARRIEIAESSTSLTTAGIDALYKLVAWSMFKGIAPAEGLVSILKKRDDRDGKTISQVQQRQTKRRVRFQEMEDMLDQDEVSGGSCILLILLCIATVFLSIGGTALYCTFGDMESPVCTDFAANMDFYYTQILQRVEELKHWITFS